MKIERLMYSNDHWESVDSNLQKESVDLVLVFGESDVIKEKKHYEYLKEYYPNANIVGCSSSANILDDSIREVDLIATAIDFASSTVVTKHININKSDDLEASTQELISKFKPEGLKHVFVLTDGLSYNGSSIVRGMNQSACSTISGGLASDGKRFKQTWTIANDAPQQEQIVAIGFYGDNLVVRNSHSSGWSSFGQKRLITKSNEHVLYELDGQPALDLYKKYLGPYAGNLPMSGLRFPLSIEHDDTSEKITRTLLQIDEDEGSITFAGDLPEGHHVRLMRPNIELLIDGASNAAKMSKIENQQTALGLIVSCVGRKQIMRQLVDNELQAVSDVLGKDVKLAGFYSYGEISPVSNKINTCELYNQTMSITVIYEE